MIKKKIPAWLVSLRARVARLWNSDGSVSFFAAPPSGDRDFWCLYAHPTLGEVYGGPRDGEQVHASFFFDLLRLHHLLDSVRRMAVHNGCAACGNVPNVKVVGRYRGHTVGLCVQLVPPADAPVQEIIDTCTNSVRRAE